MTMRLWRFFCLCCLYHCMVDAEFFNPNPRNDTFDVLAHCIDSQLSRNQAGVKTQAAVFEAICKNPAAYVECLRNQIVQGGPKQRQMLKFLNFHKNLDIYQKFCNGNMKDAKELSHCFDSTDESQQCNRDYSAKEAKTPEQICSNTATLFKCLATSRKNCHPKAEKFTNDFLNAMLPGECRTQEMATSELVHRRQSGAAVGAKGNLVLISALLVALKAFG